MAIISLEGVKLFARHGFYEEEEVLGNEFLIHLFVDTEIDEAAIEDDLFKSVNYETLFYLCKLEMKEPAKLLETVAMRIVDRIEEHFQNINGVRLKLSKLNPPLDGRVEKASVEIRTGTFEINRLFDLLELLPED
ncbi:MAG: dihydroneopterin aldolase [Saprospiraceae bacterium]|nr:dihydroneopterin aldolase [Saprospiraceae bacterium]MCB9324329.1 dihydroneopterin aldolase [Lewinellaceae bacterium]